MARAIEMRARRARVDSLRRDILGLEKSAGLRPPSPPEKQAEEEKERSLAAKNTSGRTAGFEQGSHGIFAEEMVLQDAERGARLMPLSSTRKEKSDSGSNGGSGAGGGAGGRGVRVGGWWRWWRWW